MSTTHASTEPDYDTIDAIALVLTDEPQPPSKLARKAKLANSHAVYGALRWMVANHYAVGVGNGAWTKYRARRAGEYNG